MIIDDDLTIDLDDIDMTDDVLDTYDFESTLDLTNCLDEINVGDIDEQNL